MQVKKQELEAYMEQWMGSKLGQDYIKALSCHSAYLTYMQSTVCEILGWMNQAGIKIVRRNINNFKYADDTTLMAESEEELKSLLMKVKEKSEKVGLKLNIQKMKIMSSGSIASRQIDGKQWKQCQTLFFGSKITADGDISHEIKRRLLLGKEFMTNLDSILKSRDFTLATKSV